MSLGEVLDVIPVFALVFFRLAGMMLFAPLFGSARIPRRVKVLIALVMAFAMTGAVDVRKVELPQSIWQLTVGIGGEYAFTNYLSGFIEYDYYDFRTRDALFTYTNGGDYTFGIKETKSVFKAGLNLRLGAGPVIAKY